MTERRPTLEALAVLVGEWTMEARFDDTPPVDGGARVGFEWLPGEQFLVQRWWAPVPESPDGIAIIGSDPANEARYLPHYFAPLDFRQRYTGEISGDGQTITGTWEISHDGATWQRDFDLSYRRLPS